jgi:1A family penicillin-binding protein
MSRHQPKKQKLLTHVLLFLLVIPFVVSRIGWVVVKSLTLLLRILLISSNRASKLAHYIYSRSTTLAYNLHSLTPHISLKIPLSPQKKRGRPKKLHGFGLFWHNLNRSYKNHAPRPIRIGIVLGVILALFWIYTFLVVDFVQNIPSPTQLTLSKSPLTTQIYDRKGRLLYQIYDEKDRELVKLNDIPQDLINATIAIEDKNFLHHQGIDIFGIARAIKIDLTQEGYQGGSTITQQLIKNTLLTSDQTFSRKIKEVLLAFWTERMYTKDEILTMYFNEVPYGGTAWGVEAASQMYFGKSVKDLNLAESAYLAGLPASPSELSPYGAHPEWGKNRQKEVFRRMVEDGYISQQQADEAYGQEVTFAPPRQDIKAPHFVMYVKSLLAQKYGERTVAQGGLKVITSLDLDIQHMAENVVAKRVEEIKDLRVDNGAAMVTDAKTGQILAMVGSKDYFGDDGGNYNVTLALRQPGSSIKPITYATGFKLGYTPGTILLDTPTAFKNAWETYAPVNYDGRFHGAVTVRTALGSSYNIPAVKMLALVGVPAMMQTAKDLGITTLNDPNQYGLSLTLGGGAVPMIDMMSAYNTFSQNGQRYPIIPIISVTDPHGNVLEENSQPTSKQAIDAEIAYMITHILSDKVARAPAFGTNSLLEIPGHTVAVKTGTSDNKRDNWAFGYTPQYVVGTWVGNNDYSPMDQRLASGITGASPIWHDIMYNLVKDQPNVAFTKPEGVIETIVDGRKDLAVVGLSPKSASTFQKVKKVDEKDGQEKESITFSDQFGLTVPQNPTGQ